MKVLNSSERGQGRSSTVKVLVDSRARLLIDGPKTSERVCRPKANRDSKMSTNFKAPGLTSSAASFLLVMDWRGPRSQLAAQPALCFFFGNSPCQQVQWDRLVYQSDIFWMKSVFLSKCVLYWVRLCILSVFKKLRQIADLIQKVLVLSISEARSKLAGSVATSTVHGRLLV